MQLTPRRHELISCLLLGIATLFMYLAYHTQTFITEAVIKSKHERDSSIDEFAGYKGQAIHNAAFAIASLFTPALLHYLSSKWILVLAGILFSFYHIGFLMPFNIYYFYATQVLMGLAYSLYNNGEGAYLAEHSSRRTAESNAGIETAVGHTSMLGGGLCMIAVFLFFPHVANTVSNKTSDFRAFEDFDIMTIFGTFFISSMVGIVLFALLPKKQQPDSIANNSPRVIPGMKQHFKNLYLAIIHPNSLLLGVTFIYMGLIVSFMLGVYPTTLSFTSSLKSDHYIVAIYACCVGIGEALGGLFLRPVIKRCGNYKLITTMFFHIMVVITLLLLAFLSVPDRATFAISKDEHLILSPSRSIASLIGILIGLADYTITMARAVICQYAIPESRSEVFSLARLYQCLASSIVLAISSHLTITYWLVILLIGLIAGTSTFVVVERRTNADSGKIALKNDETPIEEDVREESSVV